MPIRHTEEVLSVEDVKTVETGDYFTFEVEIITAGNIRKVLRIPHSEADWLRALISGETEAMPLEVKKRSFFGSIRRKNNPRRGRK